MKNLSRAGFSLHSDENLFPQLRQLFYIILFFFLETLSMRAMWQTEPTRVEIKQQLTGRTEKRRCEKCCEPDLRNFRLDLVFLRLAGEMVRACV